MQTNLQSIGAPTLSPPIFVTGCPRSGTSMTAGIVHRCGAFGGRIDSSFENVEISRSILRPYAEFVGCDPRWQKPLPDVTKLGPLAGLVRRMESSVKFQGYRYGSWYFKSAGLALTWPIWNQAFPNAKWIIVRREDSDVVNSCLKTGYMNAYPEAEGWKEWLRHYCKRFEEIVDGMKNVRQVWPTRFVDGQFTEIRETIEWLGLVWKEEKVRDFVKPQLWRNENAS